MPRTSSSGGPTNLHHDIKAERSSQTCSRNLNALNTYLSKRMKHTLYSPVNYMGPQIKGLAVDHVLYRGPRYNKPYQNQNAAHNEGALEILGAASTQIAGSRSC